MSTVEAGGRVGSEGDGFFTAPTLWRDSHYIFEQAETSERKGIKHVLTYEVLLKQGKTKKRKRKPKKGPSVVNQYITNPISAVWLQRIYWVAFSPVAPSQPSRTTR